MEYVVWGVGVKGRTAVDFLGREHIRAFIDTNPALIHTECLGIPVISFSEYLAQYRLCHIVITPNDHQSILDELACSHVENYSILNEIVY